MAPFWMDCPSHNRMLEYRNLWPTSRAATALVLSERGHFVLKGKLHCRLASLLDGRYTADDIVEKVAGELTPAEVYYA
jgi:hypothetical protein